MATLRKLIEDQISNSNIKFKEVAGAVDLEAVLAGRISTPGCYVITSSNDPGSNEGNGSTVLQQVTRTISIIVITKNVSGEKGVANSDENEELCEQLRELLLGFKADGEKYKPLEYQPSGIVVMDGGVLVWEEVYETSFYIKNK